VSAAANVANEPNRVGVTFSCTSSARPTTVTVYPPGSTRTWSSIANPLGASAAEATTSPSAVGRRPALRRAGAPSVSSL
jgi:hypothetical protein